MSQIFHRSTNFLSKLSIFGSLFILAGAAGAWWEIYRSPWMTKAFVPKEQPVPFSHEHHVSGLGIDCRYCHTSVEKSAFAGIPPVKTCMTCHSQIWTNAAILEPVRESYRTGQALEWTRVHDLPDFVYFNHSIHVNKGIGCVSCHGPVDRMPITWQVKTLHMRWCLGCHRHPEDYLRPRDQVFNMNWTPPPGVEQAALGRKLAKEYHILSPEQLSDCVTCHR
jgi:hypothetical protein